MGEAEITAEDGRLAADLAATLEPKLQGGLNHPTRRDVLRVLHTEGRALSVSQIVDELAPLSRSEISYHAQVLEDSGCLEVEGTLPVPGGSERVFRSAIAEDDQARLVLRATQRSDRGHRQELVERSAPGLLAMFRLPRSAITVRLLNRRRELERRSYPSPPAGHS